MGNDNSIEINTPFVTRFNLRAFDSIQMLFAGALALGP